MKLRRYAYFLQRFLLITLAFFPLSNVYAQTKLGPPLSGVTDVSVFVSWLLGIILTILWPAVVVCLVYVGFLFVSAQGNAEGLEQAKRALVWAVVGTAIVAGAQIIKTIIEGTIKSL